MNAEPDIEKASVITHIHVEARGTAEHDAPGHPVNILQRHAKVAPRVKLPGEFRTLSIHVTNTQEGKRDVPSKKDITDIAELEWHTLSKEDLCVRCGVSDKVGLDVAMAARRLASNGRNVISPQPRNYIKIILGYIFGGFGSLLRPLGDPHPSAANLVLAVILLVVIAIQATFNAWQGIYLLLTCKCNPFIGVAVSYRTPTLRIPASDLVFGDIVHIALGNKVPADLRLIQTSSDLKFDRSVLTGESNAIPASVEATNPNFMESRNMALQGTLCVNGSGKGVCVGLGDFTVFGRIAREAASERSVRTPLEAEILRIVFAIAGMALSVAVFIVILWAAWLRRDHPEFIPVPVLLIDCVSVAVVFIPGCNRGFAYMCYTLLDRGASHLSAAFMAFGPNAVSRSAGAMRKANVLCKSLSTVESLGAVNVIASDKTGTLTQNKMSVSDAVSAQARYSSGDVYDIIRQRKPDMHALSALVTIAALCNDARFDAGCTAGKILPEDRKVNGDATDAGLLKFADDLSPVDETMDLWKEVAKVTFDSKNKFAIKLFRLRSNGLPAVSADQLQTSDHLLLAPDVLFRRCNKYLDAEGRIKELHPEKLGSLQAERNELAGSGKRVLLLAQKVIPSCDVNNSLLEDAGRAEDYLMSLNTDLVIIGLLALVDPPRPDSAETVRLSRRAGVRFAMVTGDFPLTAIAIAREVGIITTRAEDTKGIQDLSGDKAGSRSTIATSASDARPTSLVLSGSDMMLMNDQQWELALQFEEIVFARVTPQQKLQIVRAFQKQGCTVAVTGDGVNDAPALKQADVGVAVASASEVAMEAADLILLSNFSAIITGIEYGRLCFENLRKSIVYLLPAGGFAELMPVLLNVIFGIHDFLRSPSLPQVLSNIQMILICVATDILPALSMVYEKPEADLLTRKPRDRKKDRLVDWKLIWHVCFIGILESLTAMTAAFYFGFQKNGVPFSALWLKYGNYDGDPDLILELTNRAQSIYFFNLVLMQWFNLLASRTRRLSLFQQNPLGGPKTRNYFIFPAMLAALGFACFFSYVPWFQKVFLTRGIRAEYFFLPMAYGVGILFIDESRKWVNRQYPRGFLARIAW
ncbi:P-type ATPase-like protein [Pleurotus eryngii]|uniref:P-type ATPase-like protein n=1 Tax=Pleurotus eryngii TaxID=5323 RepID=A0A9P6D1I5_PLEER|nr:P-type ATPase-like protein [Pleurotus eryngii]